MDPFFLKEIILVCLFIIVLFCVSLPLNFAETFQRRGIDFFHSQRYASIVSILNCFAAGIFLGTCLLHLFPEVRGTIDDALAAMEITSTFPLPEFTIAIGFFLLLVIEQVVSDFRERNYFILNESDSGNITRVNASEDVERVPILPTSDSDQLIVPSRQITPIPPQAVINHEQNASIRVIALILALTIHSVFEGIAIGVQQTTDSVVQITGALIIHKIVIAFSLGLTLTQSRFGFAKSLLCGSIFAAASPFGVGIGLVITSLETLSGNLAVGSLQGMAAGTFLYVTFLEILPNEFRSGHLHLPKLLSFIFGFSVICAAVLLFPD